MMMEKSNLIIYLREQGFKANIINAFEKVKREEFVHEKYRKYAYLDTALPIGHGQTISQPFTIAFMLNLLEIEEGQKILEVGSGSGYVLALLAEINSSGELFGVEKIKNLVNFSKKRLKENKNIKIFNTSGFNGFKEEAPFDRILVSAAAEKIPPELVRQLKEDGILVIPVKNSIIQVKKKTNKIETKAYEGFCFVPLIK